jgi:hypothetical protein
MVITLRKCCRSVTRRTTILNCNFLIVSDQNHRNFSGRPRVSYMRVDARAETRWAELKEHRADQCFARWPYFARHFPTGRAFVSDKTGLSSERRDPHDFTHRTMTTGAGNPTSSFRNVRHKLTDRLILSRQFATSSTVSLYARKLSRIRSAMPIRHYLQGHTFDPETARLLGVAFEMALVTSSMRTGQLPRPET